MWECIIYFSFTNYNFRRIPLKQRFLETFGQDPTLEETCDKIRREYMKALSNAQLREEESLENIENAILGKKKNYFKVKLVKN